MAHRRTDLPRPLLKSLALTVALTFCFACSTVARDPVRRPMAAPVIGVYFSPRGGATDANVPELGKAKQRVRVDAHSFMSAPIAKAPGEECV